jgi:hypothetical protein
MTQISTWILKKQNQIYLNQRELKFSSIVSVFLIPLMRNTRLAHPKIRDLLRPFIFNNEQKYEFVHCTIFFSLLLLTQSQVQIFSLEIHFQKSIFFPLKRHNVQRPSARFSAWYETAFTGTAAANGPTVLSRVINECMHHRKTEKLKTKSVPLRPSKTPREMSCDWARVSENFTPLATDSLSNLQKIFFITTHFSKFH